MSQWQPIETAPDEGEFLAGYWWHGRWLSQTCKKRKRPSGLKVIESRTGWSIQPSHWMPLPNPPEQSS